jgi:hypothetical protein
MKIFAGLAIAAMMMVANASATTFYVVGTCGSFNNPAPNSVLTGTWVCPTAASLGVTGSLSVASETIVYSSDYSNGLASSVVDVTNFTFSGATLAFAADTVTSTGGSISGGPISTDGLVYNNLTNLPPVVLAGFYDSSASLGSTVTVNWTNQSTVGSALENTGYAQVIYDYNVTSSVPEPVSMLLFGGGLLALSVIGRRKFSRK